ncbi:hypothetical protein B0H13DRAFT_1097550 [Mycena leptocephala]|nr:hypothetical protein B0H13DRAFT_1097550 [Mycena leptocephala]
MLRIILLAPPPPPPPPPPTKRSGGPSPASAAWAWAARKAGRPTRGGDVAEDEPELAGDGVVRISVFSFFFFHFVLDLVSFFLSFFRGFLFILPPGCTFPSSTLLFSFVPRLGAPASTCVFPFWEPIFFLSRSRHQLRAGPSPPRRWILDGVGAATREELGWGGDFIIYFIFGTRRLTTLLVRVRGA